MSPQFVSSVMVFGKRLRIEFGGATRTGVCATAFVNLQRIFSDFLLLADVDFGFGESAWAAIGGVKNKEAQNSAMTSTGFLHTLFSFRSSIPTRLLLAVLK
jgi:hypothetical protein